MSRSPLDAPEELRWGERQRCGFLIVVARSRHPEVGAAGTMLGVCGEPAVGDVMGVPACASCMPRHVMLACDDCVVTDHGTVSPCPRHGAEEL
jgi:hypothetical protein